MRRNLLCVLACVSMFAGGCASLQSQKHFKSPDLAADAMVAAMRAGDKKELSKIFGPGSDAILSSGDPIADRTDANRFLAEYDFSHKIQPDPSGGATLVIGQQDWPFPVPIVETEKGYIFDTAAGEQEILNRRIGRNELSAAQVCLAIVDAQRDYVAQRPMGGDLPTYARKVMSDPGTKNGLFWPTKEGEPASPLGPLVADAAEEGYTKAKAGEPQPPYHGYHYRLLTSQGAHARGGAADYEIDGKLIGGFGVIAFPAEYGNSGIMTFITSHDGIVYQRDLGPDTSKIALEMKSFDPSPEWTIDPQAATTQPAE